MSNLVSRLRMYANESCGGRVESDLTEAADRIETLERENRDIKYIACQLGEDKLELERENADLLAALKLCLRALEMQRLIDGIPTFPEAYEAARAAIARHE